LQDGCCPVVKVEEGLKVFEVIQCAEVFTGAPRQIDAVAPTEREHHRRLQRTFDVQVQFSFWQALNHARQDHGSALNGNSF
jgi:hypothetical protein